MKGLLLLTLAGLLASVYLVVRGDESALCKMAERQSERLSCHTVLNSEYSKMFKTPLSVLGVLYFFVQLMLLFSPAPAAAIFWLSVIGVASSAVFVYFEYVLGSLCPLCTVVHLLTLLGLVATRGSARNPFRVLWRVRWVAAVSVLLLAATVGLFQIPRHRYRKGELTSLAKCVHSQGFKMYGLGQCAACKRQRTHLGKVAFSYIQFIDCAVHRAFCEKRGVEVFPTWLNEETGVNHTGILGPQQLAAFTSCPEPKREQVN